MGCHTTNGYRSMTKLLQGRDLKNIKVFLADLHKMPEDSFYKKYMPPLVGSLEERDSLADYLETLSKAGKKPEPTTPTAKPVTLAAP